jgi:hypothetical protein
MAAARSDPDTALVSAAVWGDRAAFETLLRRNYDRIHARGDDSQASVCTGLAPRPTPAETVPKSEPRTEIKAAPAPPAQLAEVDTPSSAPAAKTADSRDT